MCGEHGHAHTLGSPVPRPSPAPPPSRPASSHGVPVRTARARRGGRLRGRDRGRRRQRGPAPGRRPASSPTPGAAATTRRMHALLTPEAQQRVPLERFAAAYRDAARTSTLDRVVAGKAAEPPRRQRERAAWRCGRAIFGTLRGQLALPVVERGRRRRDRLAAQPRPARPAPRRAAQPPDRAAAARGDPRPRRHAARRGRGPARPTSARSRRRSPDASAPRRPSAPPSSSAAASRDGAPVGLTGLERAVRRRARRDGRAARCSPATACSRACSPRPGHAVRTTIDPDVQRAAVTALAGRLGGVAVDAARATARCSRSPGSPTRRRSRRARCSRSSRSPAALESGDAKPSNEYPGRDRRDAGGRASSRTPTASPAAARSRPPSRTPATRSSRRWARELGAQRLVETAEQFGFNQEPALAGRGAARRSPPASEIGDDLALGSTAIGQGKVLATPLLFAGVAGDDRRERACGVAPTLRKGARRRSGRGWRPQGVARDGRQATCARS